MLDDLRFRLGTLFRRDAAEDDLDDELRFHLERAAEQHMARGLSPREAYRRARIEFGQMDVVKDDCRQSWGIRQLDALRQDVTFALRMIRKAASSPASRRGRSHRSPSPWACPATTKTRRNVSSTARGNGCARCRACRRSRGPAVRRCP